MFLEHMAFDSWKTIRDCVELGLAVMHSSISHSWSGCEQHLDIESREGARRHGDRSRRRLCFRRVCLAMVFIAAVATLATIGTQSFEVSPVFYPKLYPHDGQIVGETAVRDPFIEDIISYTTEVLFLVRLPTGAEIPSKERLECRYGGPTQFVFRKALNVQYGNGRVAIVCPAPPKKLRWGVDTAGIEVDREDRQLNREILRGWSDPSYEEPLQWNSTIVVYETLSTQADVTVFAKGINVTNAGEIADAERLKDFTCVFGGFYETPVTAAAQEVFRCGHPPASMAPYVIGRKMTLKVEGKLVDSVAFYQSGGGTNPTSSFSADGSRTAARSAFLGSEWLTDRSTSLPKKHHICSCTMMWNGAKFLREWVYYHSHLGVEKIYLYDNNSEDDLEEIVEGLSQFNVSRRSWPWVKTQEAGFSHCALQAAQECTWMLFTDVDEFIFPPSKGLDPSPASAPSLNPAVSSQSEEGQTLLPVQQTPSDHSPATEKPSAIAPSPLEEAVGRSSPSLLAALIDKQLSSPPSNLDTKLGQLRFACRNFGPSGLAVTPADGVTQGYTCRLRTEERHKSLVLLAALTDSLQNVIHHFTLKPEYRTEPVGSRTAVVNHYKFQAWDDFKLRFRRRAATYVADWTEERNLLSRDRVPGLGNRAVRPNDWERRFCEVRDFGLRDYARRIFGLRDGGGMAWDLAKQLPSSAIS